ncbi:hypothetical protein C7B70_10505 [Chlorogloea sp. CCALA 695]|nr:hypothetical protein C7B70_10505 [Chlorogloea sp. CCALA 695]
MRGGYLPPRQNLSTVEQLTMRDHAITIRLKDCSDSTTIIDAKGDRALISVFRNFVICNN